METQKLTTDDSGYIVDAQTNKRVTDDNQNVIKAKDFGGFRKGSRVFLSKDINTVIKEATIDRSKKHGQV